jgi:2-polyprenyl-3-methyl-5-hydroxy-6-metoxy-1,4-benzoquinol methylase
MTDTVQTAQTFPETADIETSSNAYARRFAGKTGAWFLDVQAKLALRALGPAEHRTVVDVGGGHGQIAGPLCLNGVKVSVIGSAESCRERLANILSTGSCSFQVGNVIELPFENQSFDAAVCFRLLTHCTRWPELVAELCRVSTTRVVVDYPTSQSVNRIAPALFGAKKKMEGDTRTWRLFRHREVRDEFGKHGFAQVSRRGQFFLPMVLHRMLKCRPLSVAMEAIPGILGMTRVWGSPVITAFERRDPGTKTTSDGEVARGGFVNAKRPKDQGHGSGRSN